MRGPVLDGLFHQKWYNGEELSTEQSGYVLFENKILGLPRLRQLRVGVHYRILSRPRILLVLGN